MEEILCLERSQLQTEGVVELDRVRQRRVGAVEAWGTARAARQPQLVRKVAQAAFHQEGAQDQVVEEVWQGREGTEVPLTKHQAQVVLELHTTQAP
jgi:hypothetical protein